MNDNNSAKEDFAAFTAPPPETQAELKKQAAAKAKKPTASAATAKSAKVIDETLEAAREEREAEEKSKLLSLISDYLKHISEFYPERLEFIKIPKNVGAKNSVQELRVYVKDLENELGKRGAYDIVKRAYLGGMDLFEQINENKRFGVNAENLGLVARMSLQPRQLPDGRVGPGQAVPILNELSIKYSSMFSSRVEVRFVMMVAEMVIAVHRANEAGENISKASKTEVSDETAELMKQL